MQNNNLKEKIVQYMEAGNPILYVNSFEESKIDAIVLSVLSGYKALEWNGVKGLIDFRTKKPYVKDKGLAETLSLLTTDIRSELEGCVLVIKDVYSYLEDRDVIAALKYIAQKIADGLDATVILVSSLMKIPRELEKFITILELEYPIQNEIKAQITDFSAEQETTIAESLLEEMSMAFKGLTAFEIESLLAAAWAKDGMLTRDSLKLIFDQKRQMIMKSGILEMIPLKERPEDIGGLENLKSWLERKSRIFHSINRAMEYGVEMPKDVLIAGVPGCGKSLTAKVTAQMFEVPLLRLDMGKIMGKYVGESEENMRRAIALAEAISPCVLWIDELEKAFAGINGSGNEVTVRLFGTFLTWMQEKNSPAFVIATANDITKLPPELLRKGRFDEIFYVGLPNHEERRKIFEIHIRKRRKDDLSKINLDKLARETDGYSGADIEGVVRDAVENSYADSKPELTTDYILDAIHQTNSLSEIMKDALEKLAEEYENRKFKNAS